jgi:predicted TIM-barrel fold metal-dependent hydrolase
MDRVGIDRALVYDVTARTGNCRAGNERLLDEIAEYPRLTPSWVLSPDAIEDYGTIRDVTEAMRSASIPAVRMFPGESDFTLTDDEVRPLLTALERENAVLILDGRSAIPQDGFSLEDLGDVCANYSSPAVDRPGLSVILTRIHPVMGDYSQLGELFSVADRVDNLYVATSQFQVHEGVRLFADRYGSDRLLFETHLPYGSAGAGIASVAQAPLTPAERRQIAGGNLHRLLGDTPRDWEPRRDTPAHSLQSVPYGIVDLHGHVRDHGYLDDPEAVADLDVEEGQIPDAHGIVEQMDRTGIALTCISSLKIGKDGNDVTARAAARYPNRLVPFALADPTWDDVELELQRCFDDLGMGAIKIHPVIHEVSAGDERYDPIWEFADDRECLVVTHATCTDDEAAAFERVANEHPNVTLMLYHAGRRWSTVDDFVSVANRCQNVVLEITYSTVPDGIIEHLVERVGPKRVFFGTDIGWRAPESQVGWATYARLDERERRLLMRDNGLRLLDRLDLLPAGYSPPA